MLSPFPRRQIKQEVEICHGYNSKVDRRVFLKTRMLRKAHTVH